MPATSRNDSTKVLNDALKSILKPVNSYLSFFNFNAHHKAEVRALVESLDRNNPGESIVKLIDGLIAIDPQAANSKLRAQTNAVFYRLLDQIKLGCLYRQNILDLLDLIDKNTAIFERIIITPGLIASGELFSCALRSCSSAIINKITKMFNRLPSQDKFQLFSSVYSPISCILNADSRGNRTFNYRFRVKFNPDNDYREKVLPLLLELVNTLPEIQRRWVIDRTVLSSPLEHSPKVLKIIDDARQSLYCKASIKKTPENNIGNRNDYNVQFNLQLNEQTLNIFIAKLQEAGVDVSDIKINGMNPVAEHEQSVEVVEAASSSTTTAASPSGTGFYCRVQAPSSTSSAANSNRKEVMPVQNFFSNN